jgi:ASC-1-like (ASCH) protein
MSEKKEFIKNVSEPWFSLIKCQLKRVEGRLLKGDFVKMNKGDYVTWTNHDLGFHRSCKTIITSIHHYNNFQDYLNSEGLNKCLPGVDDLKQGLSIYYTYFSKQQEQNLGVVAIRLKKINNS